MPLFKEGRVYCFAAVRLSLCWSVGRPTVSIHFLYRGCTYRLIVRIIISMSISIMGTIEQFLTELCPLNVEKFQLFAVSVFLCRGCTY